MKKQLVFVTLQKPDRKADIALCCKPSDKSGVEVSIMNTGSETELLDVFEGKVRTLIGMYNDLKAENERLRQTISLNEARENELRQEMERIQSEYGNLKLTKVLSVSGHDLDNTRKKVSGLVREIDRCIEMLGV